MSHVLRLLDYNVYNAHDTLRENEESNKQIDTNSFYIQMFGVDEIGKTYSVVVEGFRPFFYLLVDDRWTIPMKEAFIVHLKNKMSQYGFYSTSITDSKLIKRHKLYGFDNKREYKFLYVEFANSNAFKKAQQLWYSDYNSGHVLHKNGYEYNGTSIYLYEANIPPLLRFFHVKEISPSGWISISKKRVVELQNENKNINCDFEIVTQMKYIVPLNEKETRVPYKIMSFDIEASSSHGDFPVPIKTYKKLATNILEYVEKKSVYIATLSEERMKDLLRDLLLTAFGYGKEGEYNEIDLVFPKVRPSKELVEYKFEQWIVCDLSHVKHSSDFNDAYVLENMFEKMSKEIGFADNDDRDEDEDDDDNDEIQDTSFGFEEEKQRSSYTNPYKKPKPTIAKTKTTILHILLDNSVARDVKVHELNQTLDAYFPKLEGDKVTFIGSTIMNYGNKDPHMNHCIVLNNCTPMENSTIENYSTEKEVLLAWQKLVQRENPDIIIGYNIFGFDYEFMFRRADENGCVEEFLKLGRNKEEVCGTKDKESGKWKIEESTIQIASGQHDLRFIKMTGRLQVDLYNFYRRNVNLNSYKLDYVAGNFIGDFIKQITFTENNNKIKTDNLTGLLVGSYIHIEEIGHSVEYYNHGAKYMVSEIDHENRCFYIHGPEITPDFNKKIRWCLAKDDVSPKDIFKMTNGSDQDRSVIAKYCIQDCNLVHYLFNKSDILTGFIEMAKICSVPINFLVMRGQGIKLQSLIANECRKVRTLIPVIEKGDADDGYEGAIVLPPKCNLYLDNPVACNDYASLYPSSMISDNLSHDSKVWTKEYDLAGNLVCEWGYKKEDGTYMYDNLPEYTYVDVPYDTYKYVRKTPKAAAEKIKCGFKICRFAQFAHGESAIIPSILKKLLKARKTTRKLIPEEKDEFMKQVLDQRQNGYKITANSLYGGCGAKTSSFYEKDIAACTTAIGRKLLTYGKKIIEQCYGNHTVCSTKNHGNVVTNAEYIYGDTDSVFYTFNLETLEGTPIRGKQALEITIELAQEAGEIAARFLKEPHDFEYEKTFMPFCLLSKKRYVGMLYETDPNKCKRKEMGIVLKRRDNAPIVKDVYGGIIDILMKKQNIPDAVQFLKRNLEQLVEGKCSMDKLVITKSLRSGYKNPKSIAHKVLADRITERDPGNKPNSGDRIPFAYIVVPGKKVLQGNKIETPMYIAEHNLKIDYSFYITNQIMKPIQQLFALVLEKIWCIGRNEQAQEMYLRNQLRKYNNDVEQINKKYKEDKCEKKVEEYRCKEIKALLFDKYIRETTNEKMGNQSIDKMFDKRQTTI